MLLFPKARKQADEEGGRSCDDANVQRRMRFVAGLDVPEDVRICFGRARTGVRGQAGCGRFCCRHKLHHQLQVFGRHREGDGCRLAVIRYLCLAVHGIEFNLLARRLVIRLHGADHVSVVGLACQGDGLILCIGSGTLIRLGQRGGAVSVCVDYHGIPVRRVGRLPCRGIGRIRRGRGGNFRRPACERVAVADQRAGEARRRTAGRHGMDIVLKDRAVHAVRIGDGDGRSRIAGSPASVRAAVLCRASVIGACGRGGIGGPFRRIDGITGHSACDRRGPSRERITAAGRRAGKARRGVTNFGRKLLRLERLPVHAIRIGDRSGLLRFRRRGRGRRGCWSRRRRRLRLRRRGRCGRGRGGRSGRRRGGGRRFCIGFRIRFGT